MRTSIIALSILFTLYSCDQKVVYNEVNYKKYRENFEESFFNQFPSEIECNNYKIISNTNSEKNDIGLLLYVYGVSENRLSQEKSKAKKLAIASYKSNDKCLLVVNRFETFESKENYEIPMIDSLKIENDCEKNLYPIPNFIDYQVQNKMNDLKLDDSFDIYVFESKPENNFGVNDLLPNPQMSEKWKNGYSKGIAVSERKKVIIYWSVMW